MGDGKYFFSVVLAKDKTKVVQVDKSGTARTLYKEVAKLTEGDEFHLIEAGRMLNDNSELLKDLGIPHLAKITVVYKVEGGGNLFSSPEEPAINRPSPQSVRVEEPQGEQMALQPLPGYIELTEDPCCVLDIDDETTMRAKMPCGHVISTEGMKLMFESNQKECKTTLNCPKCNVKWEFFLVRHVLSATMTSEELRNASDQVDANFLKNPLQDMHECIKCRCYVMRDFSKRWYENRNRVVCSICSKRNARKFEFCWLCGEECKGGDGKSCGNTDCEKGVADRIKILQSCATKKIGGVSGCPNTRACPRCAMFIYHSEKCKHMRCKCGCNFCFVCLKIRDSNGRWQCGNWNDPCEPAPRQTSLEM